MASKRGLAWTAWAAFQVCVSVGVILTLGSPAHGKVSETDVWAKTAAKEVIGGDIESVLKFAKNEDDMIFLMAYASWCPHCIQFRPIFEKVAEHFNTPRFFTKGPNVVVGRVHCVDYPDLCNQLRVSGYPTGFLGNSDAFRTAVELGKQQEAEKQAQKEAEANETKEGYEEVNFGESVEENTHSSLETIYVSEIEPETPERVISVIEDAVLRTKSGLSLHDLEVSTALSFSYMALSALNFEKTGARSSFLKFQHWLMESHPSQSCRGGAEDAIQAIDYNWPEKEGTSGTEIQHNLANETQCHFVTPPLDNPTFVGCTQYTCGLWQTFHALSVAPNKMMGSEMVEILKDWVDKFFMCSVCRKHFLEELETEEAKAVLTQDDFIIWLWEAHNRVNQRLAAEEATQGTGDPDRPKKLFPTKAICPQCYVSERGEPESIHKDKVLLFLKHYYNFDYSKPLQEKDRRSSALNKETDQWFGKDSSFDPNAYSPHLRPRAAFAPTDDDEGPGGAYDVNGTAVSDYLAPQSEPMSFHWISAMVICGSLICIIVCMSFFMKKKFRKDIRYKQFNGLDV